MTAPREEFESLSAIVSELSTLAAAALANSSPLDDRDGTLGEWYFEAACTPDRIQRLCLVAKAAADLDSWSVELFKLANRMPDGGKAFRKSMDKLRAALAGEPAREGE